MKDRAGSRGHVAAGFGFTGAILGAAAGITQAAVGSRIPQWTGDKASPLVLGVVTVLLSLVALGAAVIVRAPARVTAGRRAVASAGLLVPAVVCFTMVGRLWFIPGLLLLVAFGFTLAAGGVAELWRPLASHRVAVLVSILGACEILMAASAGPTATVVVGVVGGAVLMTTPWLTTRHVAESLLLLLIGTVPFAILTWWSLVTPLLAVVALALGYPLIRGARRVPGGPQTPVSGRRGATTG